MNKIYVLDRNYLEMSCCEYNTNEELEQIYEDCDNSPLICGTLLLTEEEFKTIREWKE